MKLEVDVPLAEKTILNIYERYVRRLGMYERVHAATSAPQQLFVPGPEFLLHKYRGNFLRRYPDFDIKNYAGIVPRSRAHLWWLFLVTSTDRLQKTDRLYHSHCVAHAWSPHLYTEEALRLSEEEIGERLKRHQIGMWAQSARNWKVLIQTILNEFDGDPALLFKRCGTIEAILEFRKARKKNPLPGLGPKITSLIALYFAEIDAITFPEDAFPVDMHVQRVFLQTGALRIEGSIPSREVEKHLRPAICAISAKHRLDKIHLAHGFWLLGSHMCTKCYVHADAALLCPIYASCSGPVNTDTYSKRRLWSSVTPRMRKGGDRSFKIEDGSLFAK